MRKPMLVLAAAASMAAAQPATAQTVGEVDGQVEGVFAFVSTVLQACERLTQALNELAGEPIAAAHHGSISHERRGVIEERLQHGIGALGE